MATRVLLPREQVFSNIGIVGSGYRLFFYETGTTTKKDTYSDEALTIQNTNPVVADSAGRFGDIWISDSSLYKCILAPAGTDDPSTNPIWTADPLNANESGIIIIDPLPTAYWGITSGTSTDYLLDIPNLLVPISAYTNKQCFFLDFHIACGVAPTLNVNELGVVELKKYANDGTKVNLELGDIQVARYIAINDGSDIVILNPGIEQNFKANNITVNATKRGSIFSSKIVTSQSNSTDPNNDVDVATGTSFDETNFVGWGTSATTKRLDANWVAGSSQGGLDTGAKAANTWYYIYTIYNPTTSIDDVLFTATLGSPTLPSGYPYSAYKGAFKTDSSGNIQPYWQSASKFNLKTPILDYSSTVDLTRSLITLPTIPLGLEVEGIFNARKQGSSQSVYMCSPKAADLAPSETVAPLATIQNISGIASGELWGFGPIFIDTNTSQQIAVRGVTAPDNLWVVTLGWNDYNIS